jgi:hypothetical protein
MSEEPKIIRPGKASGLYYFLSRPDENIDFPGRTFFAVLQMDAIFLVQ